jgi:hypothetical protein
LEKAGQANSVVCKMCFFSDNDDIIFSSLYVVFHEFLAARKGQFRTF